MSFLPYKTLLLAAQDQFTINKSRFIGHGSPARSEEEALAFIANIRKQHKDASHNCYAYILGTNKGIMRYSDDGEPGGTAGLPIIEVLKAQGVTNCAVVVTRYFGGILLGAGGLVRAYTQGASVALAVCKVVTMLPSVRYIVDVPYPMIGKITHFFESSPYILEDKEFTDKVTLTIRIKEAQEVEFLKNMAELSDGKLEALKAQEFYHPW